ncbi:Ig-specific serine endopeptidase MIP [Mycoplasma feriruminatoris]|uniref:Immunoglobulin protease MIP n=1 Tax=Mycoplasma feriruminatoris TaxID=1179777 RepID=A0AAX3TFD0_9MOLU|nr:DUF31 family protein [Mycoplasma feriruminatoris]WFQ92522.1 Immunoglobulin protease MIP [Mycoplasma feriruminatoris]
MRSLNKLLVLLSSSTLALPLTLLVACTSSKPVSKPIDDNEFLTVVRSIKNEDDLLKYADLKFKDSRGSYISKGDVVPTQLERHQVEITFKDKYKNQILAEVTNVKPKTNDSNNAFAIINNATIFIQFINAKTNKPESINLEITGLNTNNTVDASGNRNDNTLGYFGGSEGYDKYARMDQKGRFKYDNDIYVGSLERQIGHGSKPIDLKAYRGLETSKENIAKFDEKANSINFDTYYNAALKGFTLPVYDQSGKVTGLQINDGPEVNKGPSTVDSLGREQYKTNGLARTIPNDVYRTAAIQTFQVNFTGWKDYAAEIEEAEDNIALFESWDNNRIKNYIDTQLEQLKKNYEYEVEQIDKQIQSTDKSYTGILAELNKKKEKLNTEHENDRRQISRLGKDKNSLIKWQQELINKYKSKKNEKQSQSSISGTMWIMDYLKEENNNNNPTKFYFGTNSHVAKAIKYDLVSFSLTRLNSDIKVGQTFDLNGFDRNFTKFVFKPSNGKKLNDAVTTIFHATDFIKEKSNPLKFLEPSQMAKYKDAGIFADFAVIEVDFAKLLTNSDYQHSVWSASQDITNNYTKDQNKLISSITNDYASEKSKKVQFTSESLLDKTTYEKFDRKLDFNPNDRKELEDYKKLESLYILGYPTSNEDYFLDKYEDDKQLERKKYDFSLWVNSEYKYYKNLVKKEGTPSSFNDYETEKGNFLSYQIGYRTFIDKPGLTDAFLAAHRVGKKLYTLNNGDNGKSKKYFNYGLEILPRFYAPAGGASGSSVRTKDNKLLAVYHASNNVAKTGLAAVFRSNGHSYNDLFGKYKLGQYDLIYGEGEDQETGKSYREAMQLKYKDKKSALFNDGFNNIPEEFKFKKSTK